MAIDAKHLREQVIRPTLKFIGHHSRRAEDLLMGTAAVESNLGEFLVQNGGGPAVGIFQMEPATHDSIWNDYLAYKSSLADTIRTMVRNTDADTMIGNLYYATVMARVRYLWVPYMLPMDSDPASLADYWKRHYNTSQGRGTRKHFIDKYRRFVL